MSWFLRDFMDDPVGFGRVFEPGDMMALSGAVKAGGQMLGGFSRFNESRAVAKGEEANASRALAVGQQRSFDVNEKAAKLIGKNEADAAASGAGSGATIADIQSEMEAKRSTASGDAIAQGLTGRDQHLYAARSAKYGGDMARAGSVLEGVGSLATAGYKARQMTNSLPSLDEEDSVTDADSGATVRARRPRFG